MKLMAASLPRKMLLGLPFVWLGTALFHAAGGKAALLLWLLFCTGLPAPQYPYPRKSRFRRYRLFFAWSVGCIPFLLLPAPSASMPLAFPGISALSVMLCAFVWRRRLSKRSCVLLGIFFITAGM